MAFAQGSRSALRYIKETTFGTTPSTPTFVNLPFQTHSINLAKERVEGIDITSDRVPRVDRHGTKTVNGDMTVWLRPVDYDALIESAFFGDFASLVAKSGIVQAGDGPVYLAIEDEASDITQFRLFNGCAVSSMTVNLAPNERVETTFSLVGQKMTTSGTTAATTTNDDTGASPFDVFTGTISIDDTASAIISSMNFTLDNSLAPAFVIGSDTAPQLEYGRSVVTGTLTAYFEDLTFYNLFLNETEFDLDVVLDGPDGTSYTFAFPRCKANSADVGVADEQSRLITTDFVALYDATAETNLVLTKSA